MKIAIMESLGISPQELEQRMEPFRQEGHSFSVFEKSTDPQVLISQAKDADVMILANMPMGAQVLENCPALKFVDIAFTGVDHVAMDVLRRRGITASNASGYSNEAVAELGVGLVISMLRNVPQVEQRCRQGLTKDGLVGCELMGKTVGIIGLGKIGKRSAQLYHAFGCRILASSRTVHPDCPDYITQVSRQELLEQSDIVILHCPLNDSTRGMIDTAALETMKPSALLVNLARGPVVKSQDLADALNSGIIAGAAIDVFDKEPPLDLDEPLLHAKNTIVTPHIAFASRESMSLRAQIVFENLRRWLDGDPVNVVR